MCKQREFFKSKRWTVVNNIFTFQFFIFYFTDPLYKGKGLPILGLSRPHKSCGYVNVLQFPSVACLYI